MGGGQSTGPRKKEAISLRVVLRPEARAEFDDAFDWYERQSPGLGVDFVAYVQEVFNEIEMRPAVHAGIFSGVRRAIVRRFPYSVFYRFEPEQVVVPAVFHSKRNPGIWRDRA
jgi:plasmid stabilization system protein ParE